jgi:HEAT repeat protein
MIEETNPLLVETSLALFVKFRRADSSLLPSLRPLLDHPRDDFRTQAIVVIGQILERRGGVEGDDNSGLLAEIVGRARRDASVPVRAAATRALGAIRGPSMDEVLQEIARDDPEQAVRYEAERLLYERGAKRPAAGPAGAVRGGSLD